MDCAIHPGVAAIDTCIQCARPICEECRQVVAGHAMCSDCVEQARRELAPPGEAPHAVPDTAAVFSAEVAAPGAPAVFPGLSGGDGGVAATVEEAPPVELGPPPGAGRRILRAFGWGPVYGQWWTTWTILSSFLWGGGKLMERGGLFIVSMVIFYGVIYGFFGFLAGLIIALVNPKDDGKTGTYIGIGVALTVFALEFAIERNPTGLVNIVFFYFTGQYVGAGLTGRIMARGQRHE